MNAAATPTVAVVGAGFSGTAVAMHLLARLPRQARLLLFEAGPRFARGVAYGTRSPSHWLNVPAGRLGWTPQDEGDFVAWLQARGSDAQAPDFVPRMQMGDYLASRLQDAIERARLQGPVVERVPTEVHQLRPQGRGHQLDLADGRTLQVDAVVLACGHVPPVAPPLPNTDWCEPGLIADPWQPGVLAPLPETGDVLVLGTGLTAIDVMTWLQDRGHEGRLTLLSRRGLLPQAHRTLEARPPVGLSPVADLGDERRLRFMVKAMRRWVAQAQAQGRDWRDVMASLRACTPLLWQRLSARDRRQFLRHVVPYWDTHRHRLAPGIHRRLQAARQAGHVEVAAGRLHRLERLPDGLWRATWLPRGGGPAMHRDVVAVINCTGASTSLRAASSPLLSQLRQDGWLCADPLNLGLQMSGSTQPLNGQGQATPGLFYIGPMLKAERWEAIAIPELRHHALEVAEAVLKDLAVCSV